MEAAANYLQSGENICVKEISKNETWDYEALPDQER